MKAMHISSNNSRRSSSSSLSLPFSETVKIIVAVVVGFYVVVSVVMFVELAGDHDNRIANVASASAAGVSGNTKTRELVEDSYMPHETKKTIENVENQNARNSHLYKFPVQVDFDDEDDVEVIEHPGYKYATQELLSDELLEWNIKVPKFWNPMVSGTRNSTDDNENAKPVREFLGNFGQRLITKEEALTIGSHDEQGHETIFISIATYRDPECINTINSVFLRAKYPERLRVAVIDQRMSDDDHEAAKIEGEETDPKCLRPVKTCEEKPNQVLCKYKNQIDGMEINAKLAVGPVFARHLGYRFYRGEYYAMQADSHVRFVHHWDEDIVGQWKSANNEMAVLSTYLSDLNGSIDPETHEGLRTGRPLLCDAIYEGKGVLRHLRLGQQPERPSAVKGQPLLHPYWAAGFSFARGHFIIQVPYDQYLPMIFQGEEISIGVRGFTYGYDYYAPERSACYHMYAVAANKEKRDKVPHFWEHQSQYGNAEADSMKRLNSIIGMYVPIPGIDNRYNHIEEKAYGIGHARDRQKFFDTYGIYPLSQKIEGHACNFAGISMFHMFIPHLRKNGMGINYDEITFQWKDPDPEPSKPEDK